MEKELVWYIRDEERVPIAMLICKPVSENEARIGYCCLHENDYGKFSKDLGFRIARGRANSNRRRPAEKYPHKIQPFICKFMEKCKIVFPEKKVSL